MAEIKYAPICLFTYNRLEETKQTIEALQANFLAKESVLYIFSDGWKNENTKSAILAVREYLDTITGFKEIHIIKSEINKGLANSIITGVSQILSKYDNVIVLEDDLITSPNFLDYMNQALVFYKDKDRVFSISGFCFEVNKNKKEDVFFWGRPHSWGWATWATKWKTVDWEIKDWYTFNKDSVNQKKWASYGTDLHKMLKNSLLGKNNSWYIRFAYNQFKNDSLTVYPFKSKVYNIGFSGNATHCDTYNRVKVCFDKSNKREFIFSNDIELDSKLSAQLFYYKSYYYRIIGKILTILMKKGIIKQRKQII